jgi:hypothetical protein
MKTDTLTQEMFADIFKLNDRVGKENNDMCSVRSGLTT